MIKFIVKRLLVMIPVLLGVIFIIFTINRITPGDPVVAMLGSNYTQEQYDAKAAELGLDKPFFEQFYEYIKGIVTKFDLGTSYQTKRPVTTEIGERFWNTLLLGIIGCVITVIIGVPTGVLSANKQYSLLDYTVTVGALVFASMPNFWLALMMILLFSLKLGWFPSSCADLSNWRVWVMPALAIGLSPIASVSRMTRSSMLEVVRQDYIRTARAKGLSPRMVTRRHALRNALIPVVTVIGMQVGMIIGGSVVVETIFSFPGLGVLMMNAINNKNYPVIQGCVLLLAGSICIINLVVDIIYAFIDPRVMSHYTAGKKRKRREGAEEVTA